MSEKPDQQVADWQWNWIAKGMEGLVNQLKALDVQGILPTEYAAKTLGSSMLELQAVLEKQKKAG